MSVKPESTFIRGVHKYIPKRVYKLKNHNAYVGGIADCWYSGYYTDLWIEYKYVSVTRPIAPVVPALSPQQFMWIKERQKEGRNVWVIVGFKGGGVIYHTMHEMEFGIKPKEFLQRALSRKELGLRIYDFCNKEPTNATT
jgi:hypothetical protein